MESSGVAELAPENVIDVVEPVKEEKLTEMPHVSGRRRGYDLKLEYHLHMDPLAFENYVIDFAKQSPDLPGKILEIDMLETIVKKYYGHHIWANIKRTLQKLRDGNL
jgi:hypothetical protein